MREGEVKPKWMKEIVDHEDDDDEFGEEWFKDAGVDELIHLAHLIRKWIYFPPVLFLLALSHNNIHSLNVLLNLVSYSTYSTTSSSTLSLASTHKNTSTSSITLLPPGHLLLVPLYTNRSLARLRCG